MFKSVERIAVGTDEPTLNLSTDLKAEARFLKGRGLNVSSVFKALCAPGLISRTGMIKEGWNADVVTSDALGLNELVFGDRKITGAMVAGKELIHFPNSSR